MKKITVLLLTLLCSTFVFAQIDAEQLALDVAKADAENTKKLAAMIWKRHSTATVDGEVKATIINEISFDATGKIQVTQVGGESNVKQKRGVRGRIQKNAMEDNTEYIENALTTALAYTYMSKGQLLDFFEKATITDKGATYEVAGKDLFMAGDSLTVGVEKATLLFTNKKFSSKVGEDPMAGEVKYAKFSTGVNHGTTTVINLPGKKAIINAVNQDYSQRVQ